MSQSTIDSSGSCSPASSVTSPQTSYSDTTPSPSGGKKSPSFNPHELTSKLAFIEASESLAQAAKALSLAAKAMSKAAASFAVASGDEDYTYHKTSRHHEERFVGMQASLGGAESPEWQQNSYTLPSRMCTSENQSLGELHPQRNTIYGHTSADFSDPFELAAKPVASSEIALTTDHYGLQPAEYPNPTINSEYQPIGGPVPENNSDTSGPAIICSSSNYVDEKSLGGQQVHEHPTERLSSPDTIPSNPSIIPSETGNEAVAPMTTSENQSSTSTPRHLHHRIVLDSGFDQFPVICALAKQHPKIICFYKYWGIAPSVVSAILKKCVSQAVIYPISIKSAGLQATIREFASLSTGILLWPASRALPDGPGSTALREVHALHLGEPSKETEECSGSNETVIIAQKELNEMTASARDKFIEEYPLDSDNEVYNQQGSGSLLHLARACARTRLSKNPSARGLYLPWLCSQRKGHPGWTVEELAKRANDYAEEFLLRGEPETDRFIGGKIPLTSSEIKSMGLQSAVDAGILVVA